MQYPSFEVIGVPNVPFVNEGDNVAASIAAGVEASSIGLQEHDIVVVASKVISYAEGMVVDLSTVAITPEAEALQQRVPRKPLAICQLILDATGGNVEVQEDIGHILGILPNGLRLTSGGVDKIDAETAITLPNDSDASAHGIGTALLERLGVNVGIIVADSEGRPGRAGAGSIALGSYGVPPLRIKPGERGGETMCDMLAHAGALILGQRGTGMPYAIIRGLDYDWSPESRVADILAAPK